MSEFDDTSWQHELGTDDSENGAAGGDAHSARAIGGGAGQRMAALRHYQSATGGISEDEELLDQPRYAPFDSRSSPTGRMRVLSMGGSSASSLGSVGTARVVGGRQRAAPCLFVSPSLLDRPRPHVWLAQH